jgi:hypothetical protein
MLERSLSKAVEGFATATLALADTDLERPWAWQDYDEGVRHAFFRTYEELRELAARLGSLRLASGRPRTTAQHALAQYHAAYRDLRAVLLAVNDESGARLAAEGEWPLWRVVAHILQAQMAFYAFSLYAVERQRGGNQKPEAMSEEDWDKFWEGDSANQIKESEKLSDYLCYFDELQPRVLRDLASTTDDELSALSPWWEGTPMAVEFRLHRFDSHMRQHTIHIEKIMQALEALPGEALRLLRLVFGALAEVEGMLIGAQGVGEGECQALAEAIEKRREEVVEALQAA